MSVGEADAKVKQRMKSRFSQIGVQLRRDTLVQWRKQIKSKKEQGTPDAEIYWQQLKRPGARQSRSMKEIDEWVAGWIDAPF